MGKYDFSIDRIDPNTAHGKVLSRVKPGSTVLECGCATGYMTRYMKEKLGCTVDVVELDKDAIKHAMEYARDWSLSDLEYSGWPVGLEHCKEGYDFILFADVLEHLRSPEKAIKIAVELLRPDGRIIVSIPNICHNDILIKMYYDLFTYTKYGILDDTHVHFWGYYNFEQFCQSVGLKVIGLDRVLIGTGWTEQGMAHESLDPDLLKALKKRQDGEVFQWIVELKKAEGGEA